MAKAAVVVPAHDEGSVIDACLDSLGDGAATGELEVVVVCNGCTDDTGERARRHPGVRVLDLAEASKAAALRVGTAAVATHPVVVLDADVALSPGAVPRLAEVLDGQGEAGTPPLVATPRAVFDLSGRPWSVRAFYRVQRRLPYLREAPVGPGCYALSGAALGRLGEFPDVTGDDQWVQRHFRRSERATVEDATFTVQTPRSLRYLLRVRVRVYRGDMELDRVLPPARDPGPPPPGRVRAILDLVRGPRDLPDVALYSAVNLVALQMARRALRRGTTTWERDESSRRPITAA